MQKFKHKGYLLLSLLVVAAIFATVQLASTQTPKPIDNFPVGRLPDGGTLLATGQVITPTAAPGSTFKILGTNRRSDYNAAAAEAVTTALSPDGKTLLVLTAGRNLGFRDETTGEAFTYPVLDPITGTPSSVTTTKAEWLFVFDVSTNKLIKKQQINIPNTFIGLTWAADGKHFYVSGGADDRVYVYTFKGSQYVPEAPFILLGHNSNPEAPLPDYDGGLLKGTPAENLATGAFVGGVALSRDGNTLVAANFENDSVSIVDTSSRKVLKEVRFFVPGGKVATGEYPYDTAIVSNSNGAGVKAFVSSLRDNEVLAVDIATGAVTRIPVGSQPNKMLLTSDQNLLYVANANSDSISVINTNTNQVVKVITLSRAGDKYKGSNPNSFAFSPDEATLYVTLGGENAVAVVDLSKSQVVGRIPTGWYPNSVSVSRDGKTLYVVNAKSNAGPNPSGGLTTEAGAARNTNYKNEYVYDLEKAGISVIPVPNRSTLAKLSEQVDKNNGFQNRRLDPLMKLLQTKIKHVIYVVKENRTYDQVLGDLPVGNGDPALTLFPNAISPNHHKLSTDFVTFDNFYDSGEVSGNGWAWSTYARTTEYAEKTVPLVYGNGSGLSYDYEGQNRNVVVALPEKTSNPSRVTSRVTTLLDPSGNSAILPGYRDINAPDGADDLDPKAVGGYLWDAALRAGKTVRDYGFLADLVYYGTSLADPTKPDPSNPLYIPINPTPFPNNPQAPPTKRSLRGRTDVYFRGYDQKQTDIDSYNEWNRDLQQYIQQQGMPNLTLIQLDHDHFGAFDNAIAGINTPELQMADNDYALGLLVETVSKSPYWKETAIFVVEDDAQNGPDHVDATRSLAYIISPYTKRQAVVSTNYNTVSMIRTMEDLLGIGYLGLNDANAKAMSNGFTRKPDFTPYQAIVPGNLCASPVDPRLVPACSDPNALKTAAVPILHDKQWWAQATKDFYFDVEDKLDAEAFNRILWAGIKGNIPYPTERNRADLRQNRLQLLEKWHLSSDALSTQTSS